MRLPKSSLPLTTALALLFLSSIALAQQSQPGSDAPADADLEGWLEWSQSAPSTLPAEPPPVPLPAEPPPIPLPPTPPSEAAPAEAPDQPNATSTATTAKTDWHLPLGAAGGCLACSIIGGAVWLPMALPIGLLVFAATAGSESALGWFLLALLTGVVIAPISGSTLLADAALSPILVALGAGLDTQFSLDEWWPAALGAAAGWVVLAGGMGLGIAAVMVSSVLMATGPFAPVLYLAGVGVAVLAVYLTAPAALVGAIAGDRLRCALAEE